MAAGAFAGNALAQAGPNRDDARRDESQHGERGAGSQPGRDAGRNDGAGRERAATNDRAAASAPATSRGDDKPGYAFGQQDRSRLETHYRKSLDKVDRSKRPQFTAGKEIPRAYRSAITPAPQSLRGRLPTPPSGYDIGYYQGYTVVYDPTTFLILSVIDLLG